MFRIIDIFGYTLERLRLHRLLVMWVLVGLASATTLALSLVLYVDAVNTDLLTSRLSDPPFGFKFRYLGSWEGNITPEDVNSATIAVQEGFTREIGLPVQQETLFVQTVPWRLTLVNEEGGRDVALQQSNIATLNFFDGQIEIVAGEWPPPSAARGEDDPIPVLLSEAMLYNPEMGLQVGDRITATQSGLDEVQFEVAALWRPYSDVDPRWIFIPGFFEEKLIVQEADFYAILEGAERPLIEEVGWFEIFNGESVRTSDVPGLLQSIVDAERVVTNVLPGVRIEAPTLGLQQFLDQVNILTQQLVIILMPVAGLVLYFVALVAGLLVSRQQPEDVILRSRGMSRGMLLSIHVLMWLLLAGTALAIGAAASPLVVRLIGQTTSFLRFDGVSAALQVTFTPTAVAVGTITALVAASSGLWLAFRSTRQNINSYRRGSVRATRAWWQRMYLDILLLIPGVYILYSLNQQGGLDAEADNPFANPLTFLAPTLLALGLTLLFLRVWPFLLRVTAGVIGYTRNIALLMALRELNRSIGRYRGTLLMMCFTLSLTGFTASMASTLDQSLVDTINYEVGADAVVITATDAQTEEEQAEEQGEQPTITVTGYNILPADDVLAVDGVNYVSRVGEYPARMLLRNQRLEGVIVGVDRASIAAVVRSRQDFAPQPYAETFNLLAANRNGVIVNTQTAVGNNLLINQEIPIQIQALGEWRDTTVPIVGIIDYFPTQDPNAGMFMIGNIDPIFEVAGTPLPHNLWLDLEPGANPDEVQQGVRDLGFPILEWRDPQTALERAQAEPSRRGVLGFLSVGFVASILLTLVGAIIQNTVSFRAQAIQLGSLRAMGLRSLTSSTYLILLQGISASSGILGGTLIGLVTTVLFLPLLDFSGGLPPYLVRVAWDEILIVYAIFAGVLFFVTVFSTVLASLQQLSTVIKIGDV